MPLLPHNLLLRADPDQKQSFVSGGVKIFVVPNRHTYEQNGRETNPVMAEVIEAGSKTPFFKGDVVVLHHNFLQDKCFIVEDMTVIQYDRWVMAIVTVLGDLMPTIENIVCERIRITPVMEGFEVPETAIKYHSNRVRVIYGGGFNPGDVLIIKKWADYEVVYNWDNSVRRCVVVWEKDVVGVVIEDKVEEVV